ncbi:MAG: tetratricopeptide repeat protein [Phycisphaerales bacterium]|nr:tetratricopeptide repeat protein [Phycisphaerales bacterium]
MPRLSLGNWGWVVVAICVGRVALASDAAIDVAGARDLLESGRVEEARTALEALIADGDDAEVHRLLGEADFQLERWADAREHIRAAMRLDEIAADHVRLGEVYMHEHKYALALERFRSAWRLGVMDGELHYRLAAAYAALDRIFGDVTKVNAPDGEPGQRVDETLLIEPVVGESGAFWAASSDSAAFQLQRAKALGENSLAVKLLEARIWLDGRQYDRALEAFEELEGDLESSSLSDEERTQAYVDFAEACFRADDLAGYLRRLHRAFPNDRARLSAALAVAYRRVADRYADRGELGTCIEFLEKAVAEDPRAADLHARLGSRYWEAGESQKAERSWRILLQLDPDNPQRDWILDRLQQMAAEGTTAGG